MPPVRLGLLRRVAQPHGDLVLDGDLRQPVEDAPLPRAEGRAAALAECSALEVRLDADEDPLAVVGVERRLG